jgi:hypothetical protein
VTNLSISLLSINIYLLIKKINKKIKKKKKHCLSSTAMICTCVNLEVMFLSETVSFTSTQGIHAIFSFNETVSFMSSSLRDFVCG